MKNFWKENRGLIVFITLMVLFRTSIADWNTVPTGSMKPTIVEGDRIWVNKVAYDLKIPLTNHTLVNFSDPRRSDIVIFDSEQAGKRLVKRVIAIPGDTVSMRNNVIKLNGENLEYNLLTRHSNKLLAEEKLGKQRYKIQLNLVAGSNANFPPQKIPDNYYLVLGDNRDNSADSRYIGLIPRHEIIGRARNVVLSLNYDNYYLPRAERFFHKL